MRSALQKASGEFIRRRLSLWFRGYYFNIRFIAHFIAHIIAHLSLIFMPYIAIPTAKTNSNLNTPKIYLSGMFKSLFLKFYSFCRTFSLHYSCRIKNSSSTFLLSLLSTTNTLLSGIFARFTVEPIIVASLLSVSSLNSMR